MRRLRWLGIGLVLVWAACGGSKSGGGDGGGDGAVGDGGGALDAGSDTPPGTLRVFPPEVTLDLTSGGPAVTQIYSAVANPGSGPRDVSTQAAWSLDDATLGSFTGATFHSGTMHGGTTTVHATWMGLSGTAILHVQLHASVMATGCTGCAAFPPLTAAACTATAQKPDMVYPPEGVLLPPNMNVIQVQFLPGAQNTLWEIDFENAATDVRVETRCNMLSDSRALPTGGCYYDLDQSVWNFIAQSNRGGDPLTVTVRGLVDGATCVSPGITQRKIWFASEDLNAGLYYWQSVVLGGAQGRTGGIFRYDFGKQGQTGDLFYGPTGGTTGTQTCIGCHFLSRDGQKMSFGFDDPDADDEYGDLHSSILDVATKTPINMLRMSPGFQTFCHDHALLLASDGRNMNNNMPAFFQLNGSTGMMLANVRTGTKRATQPDWSADDHRVAFVYPQTFYGMNGAAAPNGDDEHFSGGSLASIAYDATTGFGAISTILTSAGENNYYPAIAPDNNVLAFDRVPASLTGLAGDAFSNRAARVQLLSLTQAGATPVDATALNLADGLTNSWPRWSPFVHHYKGARIAWVTFSSTRDYGLRVRNSIQVMNGAALADQVNCYPPESPENPMGSKTDPLGPTCHQPQIWMAAVDLDKAGAGGVDPSYPAFWLPFQDPQAHNHIAQWVEQIVGPPTGDGGMPDAAAGACTEALGACTTAANNCCAGLVCFNNTCEVPIN